MTAYTWKAPRANIAKEGLTESARKQIASDLRAAARLYKSATLGAVKAEHDRKLAPGTPTPAYRDDKAVTREGEKMVADAGRPYAQQMDEIIAQARADFAEAKAAPPPEEGLRAVQALALRDGHVDPDELRTLDERYGSSWTLHQAIRSRGAKQRTFLSDSRWDGVGDLFDALQRTVDSTTSSFSTMTIPVRCDALERSIAQFEAGDQGNAFGFAVKDANAPQAEETPIHGGGFDGFTFWTY